MCLACYEYQMQRLTPAEYLRAVKEFNPHYEAELLELIAVLELTESERMEARE
jgi:hypothetical protein